MLQNIKYKIHGGIVEVHFSSFTNPMTMLAFRMLNMMRTISQCQNIVACGTKGLVKPMELVDVLLTPDAQFHHIAYYVNLSI
jgi:hypothetical protein